jgi:hypothetical protein
MRSGIVEIPWAGWLQRRCVARTVVPEGTPRCELKAGHDGSHAADRGMYVVFWSRNSWTGEPRG